LLGSNNIKLRDFKVHLNTKKKYKKIEWTRTEIPIDVNFYVFITPEETTIIASNSNSKKENDHWLKF